MLKIILIMLFICGISQAGGSQKTVNITIVYSNNTNGMLENCKCPDHAYGALEKRASVIDSIRQVNENVLLLDSGDILDIFDNALLHEYVMRAYRLMRYDAWVPGDQDFIQGANFFIDHMIHDMGTLLNSNILYNDTLIGQRYLIKDLDGVKIGIIGTFNPEFYKYLQKESQNKFKFEPQQPCLIEILEEIEGNYNYLILLSHSGMEQDKYLAREIPQIDLVIGGHSQTLTEKPEDVNGTYIVQAGESGYRLGILHISFVDKKIEFFHNSYILLDDTVKDHPEVVKLIKAYYKERLAENYK